MKNYCHKINYYETDKMGVTHHSNYVRIMEEARVDFFEQLGWNYEKFEEMGIVSPVLSIECNFIQTTTYPDVVEVAVSVQKISMFKLVLSYEFTLNGKEVFNATSSHCFLGTEGKPVSISEKFPLLYESLKNLINK